MWYWNHFCLLSFLEWSYILYIIHNYTPPPFLTIFSSLSMCQGQWNGTFDKMFRSILIILLTTCSWMITNAYNVSLPLPIHSLFSIGKRVYLLIELWFFLFLFVKMLAKKNDIYRLRLQTGSGSSGEDYVTTYTPAVSVNVLRTMSLHTLRQKVLMY